MEKTAKSVAGLENATACSVRIQITEDDAAMAWGVAERLKLSDRRGGWSAEGFDDFGSCARMGIVSRRQGFHHDFMQSIIRCRLNNIGIGHKSKIRE
jgi:hypothetical protein